MADEPMIGGALLADGRRVRIFASGRRISETHSVGLMPRGWTAAGMVERLVASGRDCLEEGSLRAVVALRADA